MRARLFVCVHFFLTSASPCAVSRQRDQGESIALFEFHGALKEKKSGLHLEAVFYCDILHPPESQRARLSFAFWGGN